MAHNEQDVNSSLSYQPNDHLRLFEDVKKHLSIIIRSRKSVFGVVPDPHTTMHNIGHAQGGVRYRNDGTKVHFELREIESENESLVIETLREDTRRSYTYRVDNTNTDVDISSGDYRLPIEAHELAIADLDSLSTHLGNLAILATSKKAYA